MLQVPLVGTQTDSHLDTIRFQARDSVPLYMTVYTPPHYCPDSLYPVLYLLHGARGNQFSWEEKAHVCRLVDGLILQQQIRPIIIVMPLCIVHDSTYAYRIPSFCRSMHDYLHHTRHREFEDYFAEIDAFVNNRYRVFTYAIAGLSAGGRQAAIISIQRHFEVIGLFSPVITRYQLPEENNGSLYWIRCGRGDIYYSRSRKAYQYLKRLGFKAEFTSTHGCHTWKVWRQYLPDFLRFTFPFVSPISPPSSEVVNEDF